MPGSDTFELAPTLPYGYASEPVPAAGFTADAIDADDWGLDHTAWWKVTVPADHDPTHYIVVSAERSYVTTPGDVTPFILIWQGETRGTATAVDWGNGSRWMTFNPGDVFYVEFALWSGDDPTGINYVLSVTEAWQYYTPWIQGPNVHMEPKPGFHGEADLRTSRVGPGEGVPPYNLPAVGPMGSYNDALNAALLDMNDPVLDYNTAPDGGTMVGAGGYGTVIEVSADAPTNPGELWTGTGKRDDVGALFSPDLNDFKASYTIPPPDGSYEGTLQWSELEGGLFGPNWTVTSVDVTIPLVHGSSGGTSRLYIRTYVRAATNASDDTQPAVKIDERMWAGDGELDFSFTTGHVSSAGGCIVFPITDIEPSSPWAADEGEPHPGPTDERQVRHTVAIDYTRPPVNIGADLTPPRHRHRYQVVQEPLPPVLPSVAGQIEDTRRVFSY